MEPKFYTPLQVAERWGTTPDNIRKLFRKGRLKGFRPGRRSIRIYAEAVEEYETSGGANP